MLSVGEDAAIRLWEVATKKLVLTLVAVGTDDYVAVTPDGYYAASFGARDGVAFRLGDRVGRAVASKSGRLYHDDISESFVMVDERRLGRFGLVLLRGNSKVQKFVE